MKGQQPIKVDNPALMNQLIECRKQEMESVLAGFYTVITMELGGRIITKKIYSGERRL